MKRLTEKRRDQYFVRANYGDATMIYAPGADPAQRFEGGIIDRLAAIEDILGDEYDLDLLQKQIQAYREGRYIILKEPEQAGISRLRELAQADREGRCVVLKCKPNATVWFIKSAFSTAHFPIEGNHVSIKGVACDGDIYCSAITAYNKISRSFYMSDIGKTVFLTREEAEAALRREQE